MFPNILSFTVKHVQNTLVVLGDFLLFPLCIVLKNPKSLLFTLHFSLFTILFFSCNKPNKPPPQLSFKVVAHETSLNNIPSLQGKSIENLQQGQQLYFLDSLSDRYDALIINGVLRDCPWVYVETEKGSKGWAYAGALGIDTTARPDLLQVFEHHKVEHFFGKGLLKDIQQFNKNLASIQSDDDFEKAWSQLRPFQQRLTTFANEKLLTYPAGKMPNWFWVNDSLSGLVLQINPDGKGFRFVRDFRPWLVAAQRTSGLDDDQLLAPFLLAFPEDSTEYEVPAWQIAPHENQPESLLGRGVHTAIFKAMDEALRSSRRYEREMVLLKRQMLEDITTTPRYWASLSDILKELDGLMNTPNAVLDHKDFLQLAVRRGMIEKYQENGIRVNGFGGDTD